MIRSPVIHHLVGSEECTLPSEAWSKPSGRPSRVSALIQGIVHRIGQIDGHTLGNLEARPQAICQI